MNRLFALLDGLTSRLVALADQLVKLTTQLNQTMAAIDNLNLAVTKLAASVDAAVTEIGTPHPTETAVQSAADTVSAQADRLTAAIAAANPQPPTPTP